MNCTHFIQSFSDWFDGLLDDERAAAADAHLADCGRCRHYRDVMTEGVAILRSSETPPVPEDFESRLQHKLFHVDEEESVLAHAGSGATAVAVLSLALVLTALAWSPVLRPDAPQVELAPLVVNDPPALFRTRPVTAYPYGSAIATARPAVRTAGLWDDANDVMFEYSRLSQKYRQGIVLRRAGLDQDR